MIVHDYPSQVIKKSFSVLLLALLILQSFGLKGLAAPAVSPFNFQQEEDPQALTCTSFPNPEDQPPTFCNIQIVLMIDDSGSMTNNDPQKKPNGGLRNQGAKHLVDLLATKYYLPAVQLIEKLNNENPNRKLQPPVVQVAVIHFTNSVKNANVQWMTIAPGSLDEWTNDSKNGQKPIDDVIDLQYANLYQLTSFIEPFNRAEQLFVNSAPVGDCTKRSILVFTDGVPEDSGGRLTDDTPSNKKLTTHMDAVSDLVKNIQKNQKSQSYPDDVEIYVTGFNIDKSYWTPVEKRWKEIADSSSPNKVPEHAVLLDGANVLAQLPSRMEEIIAKFTGLQREEYLTDPRPISVPRHIQTLTFTLFNLDPKATLEIIGPNEQTITANDSNVTVTNSDSAIEKWDLDTPLDGSYRVKATKTGGIITSLFTYQNLTVKFSPEPAQFQVSKLSDITFKLMDSTGNVVLPNEDPALELKVFVTQNEQTEELPWTLTGDEYKVSWTPSAVGESQFSVTANLLGDDNQVLWNCQGSGTRRSVNSPDPIVTHTPTIIAPVEPILTINSPSSCVTADEAIVIPVRLTYEGDDRSWMDSIRWDVSATSSAGGKVDTGFKTVNATSGDYEVSVNPSKEKEILLAVTASADISGQPVEFSANSRITVCEPPPPPPCFPIWLIFIWLLMGLFLLLLGWVVLRDREINIQFWMLIALELILAVVWFILFIAYRTYLLWMLLLIAILLIFLFMIYRRETREMLSWWFIIILTLFISIWFIVFGAFPFWLTLLVLLMWLGILVLVWIFLRDDSPRMLWLLLVLLLILVLIALIYFSVYWIFFLVWLLVIALVVLVIRLIGPICLSPTAMTVYVDRYNDYLTLIEGIGDDVEEILHENGVRTYNELANTKTADIKDWLKRRGFPFSTMDPTTWPEQARLAEKSKKSGDWTELVSLINELIIGRRKDKSKKPEKNGGKSPTSGTKKPKGGEKPSKKPK